MDEVVHSIINTPGEFLSFWSEQGAFNFMIASFETAAERMQFNECIFSNSLLALVKEYLQWDQRNIHMEWEPPTPEDIENGIEGSWYVRNLPDDYDYMDICWNDPGEEADPIEAERLFIIDFVDTLDCDEDLTYVDFRFSDNKPFLGYLKDWQTELGGPALDVTGFQQPPAPDTSPRKDAPYGLCPRCQAPRVKEAANMGGSGYWSWEQGFMNPDFWRWKIHCPRIGHTELTFWAWNDPSPTQEDIRAAMQQHYSLDYAKIQRREEKLMPEKTRNIDLSDPREIYQYISDLLEVLMPFVGETQGHLDQIRGPLSDPDTFHLEAAKESQQELMHVLMPLAQAYAEKLRLQSGS